MTYTSLLGETRTKQTLSADVVNAPYPSAARGPPEEECSILHYGVVLGAKKLVSHTNRLHLLPLKFGAYSPILELVNHL